MTTRERTLGALWGAVVGDALGVPVEFTSREERRRDPVTSMRGGGTWRQAPGTWSDDSSLLLCSAESLLNGFDLDDMGRRFVEWLDAGRWTPRGEVFDVGMTTRAALDAIKAGTPAERSGGVHETSNGNGSLMRILPVALSGAQCSAAELVELAGRASAITHAHPRSQLACGLYCLLVRALLSGASAVEACDAARNEFTHAVPRSCSGELRHFTRLLASSFATLPEEEIHSDGYVIHTLEASVWCLLNTTTFADAVLRAVNLGHDTDTTGCVTGGLAGLVYGDASIPPEWTAALARDTEVAKLFHMFAEKVT